MDKLHTNSTWVSLQNYPRALGVLSSTLLACASLCPCAVPLITVDTCIVSMGNSTQKLRVPEMRRHQGPGGDAGFVGEINAAAITHVPGPLVGTAPGTACAPTLGLAGLGPHCPCWGARKALRSLEYTRLKAFLGGDDSALPLTVSPGVCSLVVSPFIKHTPASWGHGEGCCGIAS